GVEDRHFVFEKLAAFAGRHSGDDLRAVFQTQFGVPRAEAAGDALDEDPGLRSDEDGHGKLRLPIYDFRFGTHPLPGLLPSDGRGRIVLRRPAYPTASEATSDGSGCSLSRWTGEGQGEGRFVGEMP